MPRKKRVSQGGLKEAGIVALRFLHEQGQTITQLAKGFRCHRNTVRKALLPPLPPQSSPVISPKKKDIIKRRKLLKKKLSKKDVRGMPKLNTCRKLAYEMASEGFAVSAETTRRDLHAEGIKYRARPRCPGLTAAKKATRVLWATVTLKRKDLDQIVFSDECTIDSNDTETHQWTPGGEIVVPRRESKWGPKCQVWGCIGINFKYLVILDGNVTSATYIATLKYFLPSYTKRMVFQQDGATPHTAKATIQYMNEAGIKLLDKWPATSPDFSPIENMWSLVKKRVNPKAPSTKIELDRAVMQAWNDIPYSTVNSLVQSFRSRLEKAVTLKGEKVQF